MTKVTLPRTNQTGANEWSDVESNDNAIIEVVNGNIDNENIKASAGIVASKLAADAKPLTWYTPKVIATEESRESTSFGTLTTADQITGVVVPENGLLLINYSAIWKSSVSAAGRAALFLGANQLKAPPESGEGAPAAQEPSSAGASFSGLSSTLKGLGLGAGTSFVTTGESTTGSNTGNGGWCIVRRLAAGTYTVSVQFRATSGSVTAKERLLQVIVLGS